MFFAALRSRSCRVRQDGHGQCRVFKLRPASRRPHAEQVLLDGYQRSMTIRRRPCPFALVLQLAAELTPARIMDRLVKPGFRGRSVRQIGAWPIRVRSGRGPAGHVADGQVLDHEHVMIAHQPGAGAVQEIGAGRADLPVRPGHLRLRLDAVRGALLAAGQPPLIAGKSTSPAGQLPWIRDLLPVRGDRERLDAQVHPGNGSRRGKLLRVSGVNGERDVPAPARVRETVTVVGSSVAGSMSGHDHTNASGAVVLASRSAPSRMENADRV